MHMEITKAIIPVAGKGTRFLPATKETPKEMLSILNYPMIYYVVKEAFESGIKEVLFVTSSGKESIENFFDQNTGLESFLQSRGKEKELALIRDISKKIEVKTVRQKQQLGLGHAVLMAKSFISSGENFAVLLGDDLIDGKVPCIKQLIEVSKKFDQGSVIGVMEVPKEDTQKYGIVGGEFVDDKTLCMDRMVEKPTPENAPTNLATPGRYILNQRIFELLETIPKGAGGEYQLTDAIEALAKEQKVYAHIFNGDRFDTGQVPGYIDATLHFALKDPELKSHTIKLMEKYLENHRS